jgi:hypothetical protein
MMGVSLSSDVEEGRVLQMQQRDGDKFSDRFVSHLFACSDVPPPPALPSTTPTPRLDHFIAYALHHTHPHPCTAFYHSSP